MSVDIHVYRHVQVSDCRHCAWAVMKPTGPHTSNLSCWATRQNKIYPLLTNSMTSFSTSPWTLNPPSDRQSKIHNTQVTSDHFYFLYKKNWLWQKYNKKELFNQGLHALWKLYQHDSKKSFQVSWRGHLQYLPLFSNTGGHKNSLCSGAGKTLFDEHWNVEIPYLAY